MKCLRVGMLVFFLVILLHGSRGFSQEMFGVTLGNYSGVNGLELNPSSMLGSKTYLDVNLLAADVFFQNNFVYMDKTQYKLSNFFTSGFVLPSHPEQYGSEFRNFYIYDNNHVRDASMQLRLNGPGAMLVYGNQAFAITTGVRSVKA